MTEGRRPRSSGSALARAVRRIVAVRVALADRAVLIVDHVLGSASARTRPIATASSLVEKSPGKSVTTFDLVLPFAVFQERVNEAVTMFASSIVDSAKYA